MIICYIFSSASFKHQKYRIYWPYKRIHLPPFNLKNKVLTLLTNETEPVWHLEIPIPLLLVKFHIQSLLKYFKTLNILLHYLSLWFSKVLHGHIELL